MTIRQANKIYTRVVLSDMGVSKKPPRYKGATFARALDMVWPRPRPRGKV